MRKRILELYSLKYYPLENNRIVVAIIDPKTRRARTAFLDKSRIGKIYRLPDRWPRFFIEYYSEHPFYDRYDLGGVPEGAEIYTGSLMPVSEDEMRLVSRKPLRFVIYLQEMEEWDTYPMDFATALQVLRTNIHPIYGLMD